MGSRRHRHLLCLGDLALANHHVLSPNALRRGPTRLERAALLAQAGPTTGLRHAPRLQPRAVPHQNQRLPLLPARLRLVLLLGQPHEPAALHRVHRLRRRVHDPARGRVDRAVPTARRGVEHGAGRVRAVHRHDTGVLHERGVQHGG